MDPIEFENFEQSIEALLTELGKLRRDNQKLALTIKQLNLEREQLIASNREDRAKIKSILAKLKEQLV